MNRSIARIALACASGGIALAVAWSWCSGRGDGGDANQIELREIGPVTSPFAEPAVETSPAEASEPERTSRIPPDWPRSGPHPALVRERVFAPITPKDALILFPLGDGLSDYDPQCGYRYLPHLDLPRRFKEHPEQSWSLVTNGMGQRRDADPSEQRPDLRVLVAGDSHTDGVCNNDESFAGLLEAALRRERPGRTVEVLNCGKGGYTFYNYLGVLRRHLALAPDVFVIGVYGGNDFLEALLLHAWFNGLPGGSGSKPYWPKVKQGMAIRKTAMAQAMLSLKYFEHRPEEIPIAFEAARQMLRYTRQLCEANGVRLIVAYLPPITDVEPDSFAVRLDELCRALELEPEDLGSSDRLADLMLRWLEARGVETLDLRPDFRAAPDPLYWALDLHINTRAHGLIAERLLERLR
jgi:lysophospholipase L1-like esterase